MDTTASAEDRMGGGMLVPRLVGWDVLRVLVGGVLLTAAALKGYQLATQPVPNEGLLTSRALLVVVVELELLLGLWLLSGLASRAVWLITLCGFALFTCVSFYKGITGAGSCGCFGTIQVNPWLTATFDLLVTTALVVIRPDLRAPRAARWFRVRLAAAGSAAILAGGTGGYAMVSYEPVTISAQGKVSDQGSTVLLKPEQWEGRRLPLIEYIDIGSQLTEGRWLVILYHKDCPVCQKQVPNYEKMAYENQRRDEGPRIALVAMPPYAKPGERLVPRSSPATLGKLSDSKKWFATTPVRIEINDGTVLKASEGAAMPTADGDAGTAQDSGESISIEWLTSMDDAKAQAEAKDKRILVDFYANWCGPCQIMEEKTLNDRQVRARLKAFVLVKINTDQNPRIVRRYDVSGIPTTLIVSAEGDELLRKVGYVPSEPYLRFLKKAG